VQNSIVILTIRSLVDNHTLIFFSNTRFDNMQKWWKKWINDLTKMKSKIHLNLIVSLVRKLKHAKDKIVQNKLHFFSSDAVVKSMHLFVSFVLCLFVDHYEENISFFSSSCTLFCYLCTVFTTIIAKFLISCNNLTFYIIIKGISNRFFFL
jgi:hypothetical protein